MTNILTSDVQTYVRELISKESDLSITRIMRIRETEN